MNTKIALALAALSYVPLAVAGNEAAYPKEKVAAFVVEKLDLTSLPSAFRPATSRTRSRTSANDPPHPGPRAAMAATDIRA